MSASILIIDDSTTIRERIASTLASLDLFSRFYQAEDGLDGFKQLLAYPVDLVLCDLEMPRIDGFKFLSMMQARPELIGIPTIILTGVNDQGSKIRGLGHGASDYITKPFDPEELIARVKVHLKIKQLQDDLRRSNELLLDLSITDYLTGLFNRRYFMESLSREMTRSERSNHPLSLIIMDIDHFKQVNDRFGHTKGDHVLQEVAKRISGELRSYDIAARFGGEEFIVILPESDVNDATVVAERIRTSIQDLVFDGLLSELTITISLGVCEKSMLPQISEDAFINAADDALYRAKLYGRNRVELSCCDTSP